MTEKETETYLKFKKKRQRVQSLAIRKLKMKRLFEAGAEREDILSRY